MNECREFSPNPFVKFAYSRHSRFKIEARDVSSLTNVPPPSYGAVVIVLSALGIGIGKTSVYRAVQAVAKKVPGMKREKLLDGYRTGAVGADVTSLGCDGKWLRLGISVDAVSGLTLSMDALPGEEAEELKAWLEPILDTVDADVLVSDAADAFKKVSLRILPQSHRER